MDHFDTGHHFEQLADNVVRRPAASRCHVDLARIGFGIGDELWEGLGRHRWINLHDEAPSAARLGMVVAGIPQERLIYSSPTGGGPCSATDSGVPQGVCPQTYAHRASTYRATRHPTSTDRRRSKGPAVRVRWCVFSISPEILEPNILIAPTATAESKPLRPTEVKRDNYPSVN